MRVFATILSVFVACSALAQEKPAAKPATPAAPTATSDIQTISSGPVRLDGSVPRGRVISAATAAALLSKAPQFNAPAPEADTAAAPPPEPPADDASTPKNGILRLDPLVVQGDKPLPKLDDHNVYSPRDLAAVAVTRYLSDLDRGILNRWSLLSHNFANPLANPGSKEQRAMEMLSDDERLKNMADLKDDAANAARAGARDQSEYIRRASDETYMRELDWGFDRFKR